MDSEKLQPGIILVRNTEAILGWTRNVFYSTISSAIFGLVFTTLTKSTLPYAFACSGGFLVAVGWYASAHRTGRLMKYWNAQLAELEIVDGNASHVRVFAGKQFEKISRRGIRNHSVLLGVIILDGGVWVLLLLSSVALPYWHLFVVHIKEWMK